jgi:Ca-activated chloride channel family protein
VNVWPAFADPLWLALLALLPWLIWLHHRRGGHGAIAVSRLPMRRARRWRLHLPFYCRLAAAVALILALARPQLGYAWEESTTEGIDIQIALDISGSMGAEDFRPKNRLEVAKQVLRDFVAKRPADRIGLTVFGGTALTRSPLTTDRRMLDELLASIELNTVPDGTAIGVALANAAGRLKASTAKSRVVLLVTDGVNNAGEIDPLSAAALAEGLGLRVYTIGVGREGRVTVPVPLQDPVTGTTVVRRVQIEAEVDEALLTRIAERTGGRFYRATDPQALAGVFGEIDRLERTPLQVKRYIRYREHFQPFAWTALGLLALPLLGAVFRVTAEP